METISLVREAEENRFSVWNDWCERQRPIRSIWYATIDVEAMRTVYNFSADLLLWL